MKEREPTSVNIINLLGHSILRSLVPDFEQPNPVISWKEFTNLKLRVNLPDGSYGLNLSESPPEVKSFLEELIKTRMSGNQEQWEKFLRKTNNFPDEFFDQSLGKFEDPNITPITLSQLNAALTEILSRGVNFGFNG